MAPNSTVWSYLHKYLPKPEGQAYHQISYALPLKYRLGIATPQMIAETEGSLKINAKSESDNLLTFFSAVKENLWGVTASIRLGEAAVAPAQWACIDNMAGYVVLLD